MYDLYDLYDLKDRARLVAGVFCMIPGQFSWVGFVLHRPCTAPHNGWLGSTVDDLLFMMYL